MDRVCRCFVPNGSSFFGEQQGPFSLTVCSIKAVARPRDPEKGGLSGDEKHFWKHAVRCSRTPDGRLTAQILPNSTAWRPVLTTLVGVLLVGYGVRSAVQLWMAKRTADFA